MLAICIRCNKQFTPHHYSKGKFCSKACSNKFRIGQPSWNKGLKGFKAGEEHWSWGKKRPEMTGERNPNWKGGITNDTLSKRRNTAYYTWRRHVFAKDNYTCQICDQYNSYLHADHIKSWKDYPELRFDVNNGRTLCRACHYYITFKRKLLEGNTWGIRLDRKIG